MTDIEEQLADQFHLAACTLHVRTPDARIVHSRIDRRRRRRTAGRAIAAVSALACVVVGLAALTKQDRTDPRVASQASAVDVRTTSRAPRVTLAVTNDVPSAGQWSRLPDNQLEARDEHLVVASDVGLLVWGGGDPQRQFDDGAYYDDTLQTWRILPAAPLATGRGDAIGVWTGTEFVVMNGVSGKVKAAAFNPTTFSWRTLEDPPVGNAANGASRAVVDDGKVILFSTDEDGTQARDQVAAFDLKSGTWQIVTAPPAGLGSGANVVATGSDVIVAGRSADGTFCGAAHVFAYQPSTGTWRTLPAGPTTTRTGMAAAWTGSEIVFTGGFNCNANAAGDQPQTKTYLFNPATGTWRDATPAPVGIAGNFRYANPWTGRSLAVMASDGSIALYNPATDTWHHSTPPAPAIQLARTDTPIVAIDGSIVIANGGAITNVDACCTAIEGAYRYTIPPGF